MEEIILSICIATHNHEKFIEDLLISVFEQDADFRYEVNICDDCSEDGTQNILLGYKKKYPDIINLDLNEKNEGIFNVAKKLVLSCKGKYVCTIDGDDRWTYKGKIRQQVEFLENNADYAAVFHDTEIVSTTHAGDTSEQVKAQTHGIYKYYSQFNSYKPDFYPWDLLMRNIIPTSSLIFRNPHDPGFFDNLNNTVLSLSWMIELHLIKGSKFKYINEVWTVYNDHPGGVSKRVEHTPFKLSLINNLRGLLADEYYKHFRKDIYVSISNEYRQMLFNPVIKTYNKYFFFQTLYGFIKFSLIRIFAESRYFYGFYKDKKQS